LGGSAVDIGIHLNIVSAGKDIPEITIKNGRTFVNVNGM